MKQFTLRYIDEGSPIASYVATLKNLVTCQKLIGLGPTFTHAKWSIFMQDLTAAFDGECMGIRTAYIRRVVWPMLRVQNILDQDSGSEASRISAAHEALRDLTNADDQLLKTCREWLTDKHMRVVNPPTPVEEVPHA